MTSDLEAEWTNSSSSWTSAGIELKSRKQINFVFLCIFSKHKCHPQAASFLPPFVLQQQQQPEVLLTPQVVNLNPQLAGPFGPQGPQFLFPNQGNQLTPVIVPNGQQDQGGLPQDPNNPNVPQQNPNTVQVQH